MYYKVWIRKNLPYTYSKYNFKLFFSKWGSWFFSCLSQKHNMVAILSYCLDICLLEKWMFCHLLGHKSIIRKSNTCETFLLPRLVREVLLCKKKSFLKVDWPFDSYTFLPDVPRCTCIHSLWFRLQCLRFFLLDNPSNQLCSL